MEDDRDADSEPDDLDALTRHYQAEAEAAKARAGGPATKVALQNKGMAELRSNGLATPLGSDTKWASIHSFFLSLLRALGAAPDCLASLQGLPDAGSYGVPSGHGPWENSSRQGRAS